MQGYLFFVLQNDKDDPFLNYEPKIRSNQIISRSSGRIIKAQNLNFPLTHQTQIH